MTVNSVILLL